MSSYASQIIGIRARIRALAHSFHYHTDGYRDRVRVLIREAKDLELEVMLRYGLSLTGKRILSVGAGHFLVQERYFAALNSVSALDTEAIYESLNPATLAKSLRLNGSMCAVKWIGRSALGVDRAYRRAIHTEVGSANPVRTFHGTVERMRFPAEQFDFVYSRSAMQHVPNPAAALREIRRVLVPGGVALASLHLYSAYNGSFDPRSMKGDSSYYWRHLMSDGRDGAVLNRVRLPEWERIFREGWPGCEIAIASTQDVEIVAQAKLLLAAGKVREYSEEELTAFSLSAFWQKK